MEQRRTIAEGVLRALRDAHRVAICAHVNPDGDTIGSALALAHGLMQLGKRVWVYCQDKVPDVLHLLPGWELVTPPESAAGKRFDLLVPVDVSDETRLGRCAALLEQCDHSAQIDHHGTNPGYCEQNEIDGTASATALMIAAVLRELGVTMNREIAICLYVGIATDTGNFAYSNTTAEAFRVVSELMEQHLPLSSIGRVLFRVKQPCQVLLLTRALNSYRFHHGGEITSMALSRKDFEDSGALPEHADTIVNFGIEVAGVKMAVLGREAGEGRVKISLRALEPWSVAGVASRFGGGGHAQAAGCTLDGPLDEAVRRVVDAMEAELEGRT